MDNDIETIVDIGCGTGLSTEVCTLFANNVKGEVMTYQIAEYIERDRKTAQRILKKLEKIGLPQQEIYGSIINLSINGSILLYKRFDYTTLLSVPSKVKELQQYKMEIKTSVSEETIKNAQEKSKKIMKKSVKQMKEQGNLEDIPSTMNELENMATMEFLKDNPSNTNDVPDDDEQEL